jgi:hypothetical protein
MFDAPIFQIRHEARGEDVLSDARLVVDDQIELLVHTRIRLTQRSRGSASRGPRVRVRSDGGPAVAKPFVGLPMTIRCPIEQTCFVRRSLFEQRRVYFQIFARRDAGISPRILARKPAIVSTLTARQRLQVVRELASITHSFRAIR